MVELAGTADEISRERRRCALLLQAVIDSAQLPTAMTLVITAEKIAGGPPCTGPVQAERDRCVRIVDTATLRDFRSEPAAWAMAAIVEGVDVPQPFVNQQ